MTNYKRRRFMRKLFENVMTFLIVAIPIAMLICGVILLFGGQGEIDEAREAARKAHYEATGSYFGGDDSVPGWKTKMTWGAILAGVPLLAFFIACSIGVGSSLNEAEDKAKKWVGGKVDDYKNMESNRRQTRELVLKMVEQGHPVKVCPKCNGLGKKEIIGTH